MVAITPPPPLAYLEGACLSWVLFAVSILTSQEAGCLLAVSLDRTDTSSSPEGILRYEDHGQPAVPGPTGRVQAGLSEGLEAHKTIEIEEAPRSRH